MTKYIPTTPTVKQSAFLLLNDLDVFFGGAAGGGKSECLLMAALQYVDMPGYHAIIFRRTFRDLNQANSIMFRAREWLDETDAHWNDNDKRWTFPSGATLTFAYLEKTWDELKYQGAEYQFIAFDELTQFAENQFTYLFSRLRRKEGSTIPLRMRSASNPGGPGHEWVKQRYIIEGAAQGHIFIPSALDDNPHVDRKAYIASLDHLDPLTKEQLLAGDWDATYDGGMFRREWFQYLDVAPDLTGAKIVRRWDLAGSEVSPEYPNPDWTAGVKMARMPDDRIVILNVVRFRKTPGGVEKEIRRVAAIDGRRIKIRIEQEPGSAGKSLIHHYVVRVLHGYDVRGVPSSGDKIIRASPLSSQAYAKNVYLLRAPWNKDFLNEIVWFPNPGVHDDQVDAASGAREDLFGSNGAGARLGRHNRYRRRKKPRRKWMRTR